MQTVLHSPRALGQALRDARRLRGLSQGQLADLAALAQPTVSKIERGVADVSLTTLLRLLAAMHLELVLRHRGSSRVKELPWDGDH